MADISIPTSATAVAAAAYKRTSLDPKSVLAVCKGGDQVVVYGGSHHDGKQTIRWYDEVRKDIDAMIAADKDKTFPIRKTFNWHVGFPSSKQDAKPSEYTLEGRKLNVIKFETPENERQSFTRPCKSMLVNYAIENSKRILEGKTPLILLVIDDDSEKPPTQASLTEFREVIHPDNDRVYTSEKKMMAKLAMDPLLGRGFRAGLRFAKRIKTSDTACELQPLPLPGFLNPELMDKSSAKGTEALKLLQRRLQIKTQRRAAGTSPKTKSNSWRAQAKAEMLKFEMSQKTSADSGDWNKAAGDDGSTDEKEKV